MLKKSLLILALFVTFVNLPVALADNPPPINPLANTTEQIFLPGAKSSPTDQGQFIQSTFLPTVTNLVIGLAGGLSLLFVIVSGIQILTAFGVEDKIANAKKTLTWAIIGLLISILSYAIVQIIVSIQLGPTKPNQTQQQPK